MEDRRPCDVCGSCLFWFRKGRAECCGCHPTPSNPFAKKALLVLMDDRPSLVWYVQELEDHRRRVAERILAKLYT